MDPDNVLPAGQSHWVEEDFASFPVAFQGTLKWYARTMDDWRKEFAAANLHLRETIQPCDIDGKVVSVIFRLS